MPRSELLQRIQDEMEPRGHFEVQTRTNKRVATPLNEPVHIIRIHEPVSMREDTIAMPDCWITGIAPKNITGRWSTETKNFRELPYFWFFNTFTGDLEVTSHEVALSITAIQHHGDIQRAVDQRPKYYRLINDQFQRGVIEELFNRRLLVGPGEALELRMAPPDAASIWMEINDICNFGCDMCFQGQADTIVLQERRNAGIPKIMSHETIEKITQQIGHYALVSSKKRLDFKIAGGEPTLTPDTIFDVVQTARANCPTELELSFSLVTNGSKLTPELIEKLKEHNVHVAISLGGTQQDHDHIRHDKGGKGTYAEVINGLQLLKKHQASNNISIVVNNHSAQNLGLFAKEIFDQVGWTPFSITFNRDNPYATQRLDPSNEQLITGLRDFYAELYSAAIKWKQPIQPTGLLDYFNLTPARTEICGAGNNYIAYSVEGHTNSCHMLTYRRIDKVGTGDPFQQTKKSHPVAIPLRNVDNRDNGCPSCFLRYQCVGGGCQLHQRHVSGSYVPPKPVYCDTYKTMGPEYIALAVSANVANGFIDVIE